MANNIDQMIADLTVTVEALTTVIDSAVAFINGVPALIEAAVEEARNAGATDEQLSSFTTLVEGIQNTSESLAAALIANTPDDTGGEGGEEPPTE